MISIINELQSNMPFTRSIAGINGTKPSVKLAPHGPDTMKMQKTIAKYVPDTPSDDLGVKK